MEDILGVYKIEGLAIYSKDWGVIAPANLGNGILALILLYYCSQGKYSRLISNACMGRNIGPYLRELSLEYDFEIAWDEYLFLGWDLPVSAKDAATGKVFTNTTKFLDYYDGEVGEYPELFKYCNS